ncbi:MAG: hypothetical protein GTN93_00590, partial [Anaerolineae bacterium]|nr:hypothetical protein [Anaerolineae bacterium]NIQ76606.1 hypothetical protein [Anaerolineae bacterium]
MQWDNGSPAYFFSGWNVGDQSAMHFNPAAMCPDCDPDYYPFQVTRVEGLFYDHAGVGVPLDVIVHFYEAGDICMGPGTEIYSFPYTVTTFYPDMTVIPVPELLCLEDDFFVSIEFNSGTTGSIPCLLMTDEVPDTCVQWNEYLDYGWIEWWDFWSPPPPGYNVLRVAGVCAAPECYPGEECYMFQGSGAPASYWSGWGEGDGVAKYYDPTEHCTAPVYPVRIDAVDVALYDYPGVGAVDVEVAIYLECSNPCDGPGTEIYRTDPINVTTFYPNVATITLPELVCIYEPFFVAIHYPNVVGQVPSVLFDDNSVPYDTCHAWMWYESAGYSPPWYEWWEFWAPPPPGNPMIYVLGYTQSPACDIPQCDTTIERLPGGEYASYYWRQPPNDSLLNMRFEMPADHGGRLEYFNVAFYQTGTSG